MCTHTHTHLCTLSHTHALIKYCFTWRFYKRKLPFFKTLARCTVAFCCRHFVSQTMACTHCRVCFCVCVCASECVGVSIFPCDNSLLWHTLRAWHSHSHSQSQLALFFCACVCVASLKANPQLATKWRLRLLLSTASFKWTKLIYIFQLNPAVATQPANQPSNLARSVFLSHLPFSQRHFGFSCNCNCNSDSDSDSDSDCECDSNCTAAGCCSRSHGMLLPLPAAQPFSLAVFPLFNDVCFAKHAAGEFLGHVALNL